MEYVYILKYGEMGCGSSVGGVFAGTPQGLTAAMKALEKQQQAFPRDRWTPAKVIPEGTVVQYWSGCDFLTIQQHSIDYGDKAPNMIENIKAGLQAEGFTPQRGYSEGWASSLAVALYVKLKELGHR